MRNFNKYLGTIAVLAMLFTSCSKEETDIVPNDDANATLSFGTVLNDLLTNKQQTTGDIPECSDDIPAYVEVVITGEENVGSIGDPLVIDVNSTPIEEDGEDVYFTEESAELELTPGNYQLTYFAVYNEDDDLIWLAPTVDGDLSGFVDTPLPLDISLGAGVKKYVDVEVLCFDDRIVNQYGYLFFDIINREAFEFCFFANYCNEAGRHYPAHFSVEIWLDDGTVLYAEEDHQNEVSTAGDDPSADPICFALPNIPDFDDDEDYIHYRLTLLDWEGVYGDVTQMEIEGSLSRADILANLNADGETVEYHHERFGCADDDPGNGNGGDQDSDDDGVPDSIDECPNTPEDKEVDEVGCPVNGNGNGDQDSDNDGVPDSEDDCPNTPEDVEVDENGCPVNGNGEPDPCLPDPDYLEDCVTVSFEGELEDTDLPYQLMLGGESIGTLTIDLEGGDVTVEITMNITGDAYLLSDVEILCDDEIQCYEVDLEGQAEFTLEDDFSFGDDIRIRANVCPI